MINIFNNITKRQIAIVIITIVIVVVSYFIYNKVNIEDKEIVIENILIESKTNPQNEKQKKKFVT